MMNNPYFIEGPALISFSGGRTSGYMLRQILDAYDGTLPDDIVVSFQNTGKEAPQTLDFIQECSDRWAVPIVWLEYEENTIKGNWFKIVNHNSASRNGEPFKKIIEKYDACPSGRNRFCTGIMKVQTAQKFARHELLFSDYLSVIGLRADEPRRVANITNNDPNYKESVCPVHTAGDTIREINAFWLRQDFRLNLPLAAKSTPLSNCDLCFLKGIKTIIQMIKDDPSRADWWIKTEERYLGEGGFAKEKPSYRRMKEIALSQGDLFDIPDDATIPCMCTD
jgi:3'-phosphoadenosine 5'-phosphosulfate sulfotransferase (PAPS reductase)/FAD synthetase